MLLKQMFISTDAYHITKEDLYKRYLGYIKRANKETLIAYLEQTPSIKLEESIVSTKDILKDTQLFNKIINTMIAFGIDLKSQLEIKHAIEETLRICKD